MGAVAAANYTLTFKTAPRYRFANWFFHCFHNMYPNLFQTWGLPSPCPRWWFHTIVVWYLSSLTSYGHISCHRSVGQFWTIMREICSFHPWSRYPFVTPRTRSTCSCEYYSKVSFMSCLLLSINCPQLLHGFPMKLNFKVTLSCFYSVYPYFRDWSFFLTWFYSCDINRTSIRLDLSRGCRFPFFLLCTS